MGVWQNIPHIYGDLRALRRFLHHVKHLLDNVGNAHQTNKLVTVATPSSAD